MSYEITGHILSIGTVKQITDTFKKQELVIEVQDGEYSNVIVLDAVNDKVEALEQYKVGEEVQAGFYISGNNKPWIDPKTNQPRYFNSLKLGHISSVKGEQVAPPQESALPPVQSNLDDEIAF